MCGAGVEPLVVYYSSSSENTHRFIRKLNVLAVRINPGNIELVDQPFVLITPTYGSERTKQYIPKPVVQFLNNFESRRYLCGVIASGNSNFGREFALAGDIIATKCQVPYLYRFELMGTAEDVAAVQKGLTMFFTNL